VDAHLEWILHCERRGHNRVIDILDFRQLNLAFQKPRSYLTRFRCILIMALEDVSGFLHNSRF